MYKYITIEKIQRSLGRRANVFSSDLIPTNNISAISTNLDVELIHDLIIRNESLIDTYFGMIYVLPIDTRDIPLIEPIVEGFVINDLMMRVYDQGMIASLGGDGGFGSTIYQKAKELLKGYFIGSGVYIPGVFAPEDNAMREAYPLLLPYTPQLTERRDNITRNYTVIGKYQNNRKNMEFDFREDKSRVFGLEERLW
jgi:hypothetical protein